MAPRISVECVDFFFFFLQTTMGSCAVQSSGKTFKLRAPQAVGSALMTSSR